MDFNQNWFDYTNLLENLDIYGFSPNLVHMSKSKRSMIAFPVHNSCPLKDVDPAFCKVNPERKPRLAKPRWSQGSQVSILKCGSMTCVGSPCEQFQSTRANCQ